MNRALATSVLLLLFSLPATVRAEDARVEVGHGKLEPAEVIVTAGDLVTWKNTVQMPGGHTVTSDDGSFESPALGKDESWSHRFEKLGSHGYHIKQHPDAKGKVVVE